MAKFPSYVELRLDRRTYRPGDLVTGTVTVVTSREKKFDSIRVTLEGRTDLEVSPRDVGLFEAFYSPTEPIIWVKRQTDLAKNGMFSAGRNTFNFEFALAPTTSRELVETLKGVYVKTTYIVRVSVYRSFSRTLTTDCELYVQVPAQKAINRSITPPNQFRFSDIAAGEIQSICSLNQPISGHIMFLANQQSNWKVLSIDLELVRVEDIYWGEEPICEICQIHTSQIIDGNLPSGTLVPFFFIVPRLLASPSYECNEFKVSYYMNVSLSLKENEGELVTRSAPITFVRS